MTETKKMSRRSRPLGPFCHVRICSEFIFASETSPNDEDLVAWFNPDIDLWTVEHQTKNIDKGFYEIVIAAHPPLEHDNT